MTLQEYANQWNLQHEAYERKVFNVFYKALEAQVTPVLKYMEANGSIADSDIENLVSIRPMRAGYSLTYETIGVLAAKREFALLRKENPVKANPVADFFSVKWARWMREYALLKVGDLIQKVSDHTKEQIRFALAKAYEEGATFTEQIKLVREYTLGEIGRDRALTIARTETTRAAAEGKRIGATDWAKENGTTLYKKWIHTGRTENDRKYHMAMMSEKPIKEGDQFLVRGELMTQPGDPKAKPSNTVNCACTIQFMSERKARRDYGV